MTPDGNEFEINTKIFNDDALILLATAIENIENTFGDATPYVQCQNLARRIWHVVGRRCSAVKIEEII